MASRRVVVALGVFVLGGTAAALWLRGRQPEMLPGFAPYLHDRSVGYTSLYSVSALQPFAEVQQWSVKGLAYEDAERRFRTAFFNKETFVDTGGGSTSVDSTLVSRYQSLSASVGDLSWELYRYTYGELKGQVVIRKIRPIGLIETYWIRAKHLGKDPPDTGFFP